MRKIKKILSRFFCATKKEDRIIITFFGLRFKFKSPTINRLQELCCIENLEEHLANRTYFPHPVGIVISRVAKIGKDCHIYQNVTLGMGKHNSQRDTAAPILEDRVVVWAGAIVVGGVLLGEGCVIGANSLVLTDVPSGCVYAGNPARFIRKATPADY